MTTCEPPPEAREVRWHWVRTWANQITPAAWNPNMHSWTMFGGINRWPQDAYKLGYRYVAPIPMPETETETENHQ